MKGNEPEESESVNPNFDKLLGVLFQRKRCMEKEMKKRQLVSDGLSQIQR